MMLDKIYISGVTQALCAHGFLGVDDFVGVVEKVAADLGVGQDQMMAGMDPMMAGQDPMAGMGQDPGAAPGPTPEQLQQVAASGLTDKDIESAAKVVQVLAEMKQTADQMGMGPEAQQAQAQGAMQPMPMQQQMPLPQPPQSPQQKMAALLEHGTPEQRTFDAIQLLRQKLRD